ncbi:MAG: tRNA lysidine(34) synthetase TilS [Peptococcaceae bacterium]|nr:tRNA lysidine(34) synthetase TilS [Peptococcaceae bacterium]
MKQVWQTIEQFHMLEAGDRVLAGVSGGPDSIALLHLLDSCTNRYGFELFVVHVNHRLRPEADGEAQYVQQFCEQKQIPFQLFAEDVADYAKQYGMSLEQAGHEVRHTCFRKAAETWNITKLALGHHGDDRAESVLLHLVQGCGLDGLTAMPPKDGWLIRPFAFVQKKDLVQYCEQYSLQYFTDATNLEPGCLRNQIRLEVLPRLKAYNPQITESLLRLQESCGADADYLEQYTETLWHQYGSREAEQAVFPADVLREQHIAMQRRILRCMYRQVRGSEQNLSFGQTEQMRQIAMTNDGSQELHLADGLLFVREYNRLCVTRKLEKTSDYQYLWHTEQELFVPESECVFKAELDLTSETAGAEVLDVDYNRISLPLTIRHRKPGDVLKMPFGRKKLKDFFIDKKIPVSRRDCIPVVLSGSEIIWIPGYYKADCVRINDETEQICRLSCKSCRFS